MPEENTYPAAPEGSVRINKYLASCGFESRRAADKIIADGRVEVNGQRVDSPGLRVLPTDFVKVDGHHVTPKAVETVLLNKPRGFVCSREAQGAKGTVYDLLPPKCRHLNYAGRLDADSEGLIIFTNDGDLMQKVPHPHHGVEKEYSFAAVPENSTEFTSDSQFRSRFGQYVTNGFLDDLGFEDGGKAFAGNGCLKLGTSSKTGGLKLMKINDSLPPILSVTAYATRFNGKKNSEAVLMDLDEMLRDDEPVEMIWESAEGADYILLESRLPEKEGSVYGDSRCNFVDKIVVSYGRNEWRWEEV